MRDYAEAQSLSGEEALKKGLHEKAAEFLETGAEIYR